MTDLVTTIDAIIRRERIPDRAGAAIVDMLSETHVIVERGDWDRLVELASWGDADMHDALLSLGARSSDLARDAPGGDTPLGNGG